MSKILVYPAVFNPASDGSYEVSFPDFPGCVTFGRSLEEAQEKAAEILSLWVDELEARHEHLPQPAKKPIVVDVAAA